MFYFRKILKKLGRLTTHFSESAPNTNELSLRRELKAKAQKEAQTVLKKLETMKSRMKAHDIPACHTISAANKDHEFCILDTVTQEELESFLYQKLCHEDGLNQQEPELSDNIYKARTDRSLLPISKNKALTIIETSLELPKINATTPTGIIIGTISLKTTPGDSAEDIHARYCRAYDVSKTRSALRYKNIADIDLAPTNP